LTSKREYGHGGAKISKDPLFQLLADGYPSVPYRPILKELVGDTNAAILLQQIAFWFVISERKPFYKFVAPNSHPLYQHGDSWVEELGFTEAEYNRALKKIATRIRAKAAPNFLMPTSPEFGPDPDKRNKKRTILRNRRFLVVYWREVDNKLRFMLNEKLLIAAMQELNHRKNQEFLFSGIGHHSSQNGKTSVTYNRNNTKEKRQRDEKLHGKAADELDKAISEVWDTRAPAMIARIKTTLLGEHPESSPYFLANINPPATPEDVFNMRKLLQAQVSDPITMPTDPAKIQHWIYEARAVRNVIMTYRGHRFEVGVEVPLIYKDAKRPELLKYLERQHPEEYKRLQHLMKRIDEEFGTARKRINTGYYTHKGVEVEIRAEIPNKVWNSKDSSDPTWAYIADFWPREAERILSEFQRIDQEQEAEAEIE